MDPQEITDKLKVRKRILQIVAAAVAICVVAWLAVAIYAAIIVNNSDDGYYTSGLIVNDSTEVY